MKKIALLYIMMMIGFVSALAQDSQVPPVEEEAESSIFWEDQEIAQLEEMTPKLAASAKRMETRIKSVAVSTVTLGEDLSPKLHKILVARIYEILTRSSTFRVGKCEECSQVRSDISGSFLRISRGVADDEYRRKKARELNVDGFLDINVFMSKRQLSVSLTAYEAESGKVVFSDIVTGPPGVQTTYTNLFLGIASVPLSCGTTVCGGGTGSGTHSAYILGAEISKRIARYWLFSGTAALLADNSSNLQDTEKVIKDGISGFVLDGMMSWEMVSALGGGATLSLGFGTGQMLVTALNSPNYWKYGLKGSVGEKLTLNLYFLTPNNTKNPTVGTVSYTALGWQF